MKTEPKNPDNESRWAFKEARYSLKSLMEEVAEERLTGTFGAEKLRQADITRLFDAKTSKRRPARA